VDAVVTVLVVQAVVDILGHLLVTHTQVVVVEQLTLLELA
jgi:hypothetical protein